jgi:hypothetical protein
MKWRSLLRIRPSRSRRPREPALFSWAGMGPAFRLVWVVGKKLTKKRPKIIEIIGPKPPRIVEVKKFKRPKVLEVRKW